MGDGEVGRIAGELLAVLGTGRQVGRYPALGMADAYAVGAEICARRRRRGERVVGRKIGFTNTAIWPLYGVSAPMWSFMYDTTVRDLDAAALDVAGMPEPRIEPEIVLGLGEAPDPGMSDDELLRCVDWVAHGFEIVQSVYPGWKLTIEESAAAFGLHGALRIGPRHRLGGERAVWGERLPALAVTLRKGAVTVAEGVGANVLGGPIRALRFLVAEIARYPAAEPIAAGEVITTGTLTDAQPVAPGEEWSTEVAGITLDGIRLAVA